MVDRIKRHAEGDPVSPDRTSQTLSTKPPNRQTPPVDELILSLANARENRRARQVNEWERIHPSAQIYT